MINSFLANFPTHPSTPDSLKLEATSGTFSADTTDLPILYLVLHRTLRHRPEDLPLEQQPKRMKQPPQHVQVQRVDERRAKAHDLLVSGSSIIGIVNTGVLADAVGVVHEDDEEECFNDE